MKARIFIDVPNIGASAQNIFGQKADFKKVVDRIKKALAEKYPDSGQRIFKTTAYVQEDKLRNAQKFAAFVSALERAGIEVKTTEVKTTHAGKKNGDVDPAMTADIVKNAAKNKDDEIIVIASGDGHFISAVEATEEITREKKTNSIIAVAAFERTLDEALKKKANFFIGLQDESILL